MDRYDFKKYMEHALNKILDLDGQLKLDDNNYPFKGVFKTMNKTYTVEKFIEDKKGQHIFYFTDITEYRNAINEINATKNKIFIYIPQCITDSETIPVNIDVENIASLGNYSEVEFSPSVEMKNKEISIENVEIVKQNGSKIYEMKGTFVKNDNNNKENDKNTDEEGEYDVANGARLRFQCDSGIEIIDAEEKDGDSNDKTKRKRIRNSKELIIKQAPITIRQNLYRAKIMDILRLYEVYGNNLFHHNIRFHNTIASRFGGLKDEMIKNIERDIDLFEFRHNGITMVLQKNQLNVSEFLSDDFSKLSISLKEKEKCQIINGAQTINILSTLSEENIKKIRENDARILLRIIFINGTQEETDMDNITKRITVSLNRSVPVRHQDLFGISNFYTNLEKEGLISNKTDVSTYTRIIAACLGEPYTAYSSSDLLGITENESFEYVATYSIIKDSPFNQSSDSENYVDNVKKEKEEKHFYNYLDVLVDIYKTIANKQKESKNNNEESKGFQYSIYHIIYCYYELYEYKHTDDKNLGLGDRKIGEDIELLDEIIDLFKNEFKNQSKAKSINTMDEKSYKEQGYFKNKDSIELCDEIIKQWKEIKKF